MPSEGRDPSPKQLAFIRSLRKELERPECEMPTTRGAAFAEINSLLAMQAQRRRRLPEPGSGRSLGQFHYPH